MLPDLLTLHFCTSDGDQEPRVSGKVAGLYNSLLGVPTHLGVLSSIRARVCGGGRGWGVIVSVGQGTCL